MTNTKLYEARISEEGISALRKLLGVSIYQLFSPALEVHDRFITSPNFSLPLCGNEYLIMQNSWLETPKEYIDYWSISAHCSTLPKDIKVVMEEKGQVIVHPVSCIYLLPASRIVKISIYEAKWSDSECEESVVYDHAVVFHPENGIRFCIMANQSIADLLDFTNHAEAIELIVQGHTCRKEIE